MTLANLRNTNAQTQNVFTLTVSDGQISWEFDDDTTRKIVAILDGFADGNEVATPTPTKHTSAKTSKKSSKKRTPATDASVTWKRSKNVLAFDGYQSKDTYGILKAKAEQVGATYTKGVGFTFKYAKDATAFAKANTVVTAEERNNFRKSEWGWA